MIKILVALILSTPLNSCGLREYLKMCSENDKLQPHYFPNVNNGK